MSFRALALPCCNSMFTDDPLKAQGLCIDCGPTEFWVDAAWQYYKVPILIGAALVVLFMVKK